MSLLLSQLGGGSDINADAALTQADAALSAAAAVIVGLSASLTQANAALSAATVVIVGASASLPQADAALLAAAGVLVSADGAFTQDAVLSADVSTGGAPSQEEAGAETVLVPYGAALSRKKWRELLALIDAEKAALKREDRPPALIEAISAADRIIGLAQATGILPGEIRGATRALAAVTRANDASRQASVALDRLRNIEADIYRRVQDERDMEALIIMGVL